MIDFEKARLKYKPSNIKILFIAETPPKTTSNRFFYYENVNKGDSLFVEIMKFLYNLPTKEIRPNKKKLLNSFMNKGYYLIDSIEKPFEKKYTPNQKIKFIIENQSLLLKKIKKLSNENLKTILISSTVYKANYRFLLENKINVINKEHIDFPGSGNQKKFHTKMNLLKKINKNLF